MYHGPVHSLAERVLAHIRRQELLRAGDRVGVAVSGGIDSVALLRLLLELRQELGTVVSVVHFNHRLRGAESDVDQEFVVALAREHDLEFFVDGEDVAQRAAEDHVSVETAARELRYGFFRYLLGEDGADPQGLKPAPVVVLNGAAEAEPFHEPQHESGVEPQHGSQNESRLGSRSQDSVVESRPASNLFSTSLYKIATGHTLDDQAETVLMRMIRGAGLRGLAGIHPRILVEDEEGDASGEIIRPLLGVRRRELEQYLKDIGQAWREDSTNADERFTRNRIRKLVVPLLEQEFNPVIAENLAELADIARGEEDYWENEISGWLGTTVQWSEPDWARATSGSDGLVQIAGFGIAAEKSSSVINRTSRAEGAREMGHPENDNLQAKIARAPWLVMNASVSRMWFLGEPLAVQRRLVKAIGEYAGIPLEFKHVEEILRVAGEGGASGKELSLPLGWKLILEPEQLVFVTPDLRGASPPIDYDYELPIPGRVQVYEAGSSLEVRQVPEGANAGYNPDHLLDAESLPGPLRVRNWRSGDRFWPAHTKSPRKIKELLQECHVAHPERKAWPVIVSGDEIVWLRGFPSPAKLRAKPGRAAILILDEPLLHKSATES